MKEKIETFFYFNDANTHKRRGGKLEKRGKLFKLKLYYFTM